MAALHGKKIRTHITLSPEEHARFLACVEVERSRQTRPVAITLTSWLAGLGHDRCDAEGIPPTASFAQETPPAAEPPSKPRRAAPKKRT